MQSLSLYSLAVLNLFIQKLDARYERARKPGPGVSANARRERIEGQASTSTPPSGLPSWMIDADYQEVIIYTTIYGIVIIIMCTFTGYWYIY